MYVTCSSERAAAPLASVGHTVFVFFFFVLSAPVLR